MRPISSLMVIVGLLGGLSCHQDSAPAQQPEAGPPPGGKIVVGDVSLEVARKVRKWRPLADYLGASLGELGIGAGEMRLVQDVAVMAHLLRNGEVDLYMDSFYPVCYASVHSGAQPLLLRRKSTSTVRGTVFSKAGSGINSVTDFEGRMIAIEERHSTTGFLLPLAHLVKHGLNPVEKSSPAAPVAPDEVGFTFTGDDDNTIQWVINGRVAAGAVDDDTFDKFARANPEALVDLGKTDPILRHQLLLARPDMPPRLREAIKELLRGLADTAEGQALLEQLDTVAFTDVSEQDEAEISKARALFDLVERR